MTTPEPSTPDDDYPISARDADEHRARVATLNELATQAITVVNQYTTLGDQVTPWQVLLPMLPNHLDDQECLDSRGGVVPADLRLDLEQALNRAGQLAYVVAGYYRRRSRLLEQALENEFHDPFGPCFSVLAMDQVGRLGYIPASDNWMFDGEPLGEPWRTAAYQLQAAGLLPKFDRFFTSAKTAGGEG